MPFTEVSFPIRRYLSLGEETVLVQIIADHWRLRWRLVLLFLYASFDHLRLNFLVNVVFLVELSWQVQVRGEVFVHEGGIVLACLRPKVLVAREEASLIPPIVL